MRIHWSVATAALAAAVIHLPLLEAQQSTAVEIGVRVRVTSDAAPSTSSGKVVVLTRDSLEIAPANAEFTIGFRRAEITRLEISSGRRQNKLKGFWIGALVGAGTGAVAGFASGDDSCIPHCTLEDGLFKRSAAGKAVELGVMLGLAGGLIGTIVGAFTTSERWVTASSIVVPIVDARGRVGLAISY